MLDVTEEVSECVKADGEGRLLKLRRSFFKALIKNRTVVNKDVDVVLLLDHSLFLFL